MRDKIFLLILAIFLVSGCSFSKKEETVELKETPVEQTEDVIEEPKYVDDNPIKIAFYNKNGYTLSLAHDYNGPISIKKDITTFQVFFSNEDQVQFSNMKFVEYFYNTFNELNPEKKYKIGFNLSYDLTDGTHISQNIFGPSTTQTNYDYIEVYLYDSYKHRNDSFYSHIEEYEYNEETLMTSIKLTAGSKFNDISSKITLSVFTYDEDDFDEETSEYRGVSKYSLLISNSNKNYE